MNIVQKNTIIYLDFEFDNFDKFDKFQLNFVAQSRVSRLTVTTLLHPICFLLLLFSCNPPLFLWSFSLFYPLFLFPLAQKMQELETQVLLYFVLSGLCLLWISTLSKTAKADKLMYQIFSNLVLFLILVNSFYSFAAYLIGRTFY